MDIIFCSSLRSFHTYTSCSKRWNKHWRRKEYSLFPVGGTITLYVCLDSVVRVYHNTFLNFQRIKRIILFLSELKPPTCLTVENTLRILYSPEVMYKWRRHKRISILTLWSSEKPQQGKPKKLMEKYMHCWWNLFKHIRQPTKKSAVLMDHWHVRDAIGRNSHWSNARLIPCTTLL